jgi:hypothetical protein
MISFGRTAEAIDADELCGEELIALAEELVAKGFSPPPQIYRVEYRRRIDWSKFPVWARPLDPDIFEGCCHEG